MEVSIMLKKMLQTLKHIRIIAVLVILTAVIVTLVVYYTPGQQDQVGN